MRGWCRYGGTSDKIVHPEASRKLTIDAGRRSPEPFEAKINFERGDKTPRDLFGLDGSGISGIPSKGFREVWTIQRQTACSHNSRGCLECPGIHWTFSSPRNHSRGRLARMFCITISFVRWTSCVVFCMLQLRATTALSFLAVSSGRFPCRKRSSIFGSNAAGQFSLGTNTDLLGFFAWQWAWNLVNSPFAKGSRGRSASLLYCLSLKT